MIHLGEVEIDLIEMSSGCAEQCSHCSESPDTGLRHACIDNLLEAVSRFVKAEEREGVEFFGNYWFPFPASDPFAYPDLFALCEGIWRLRALPVYLLSLGWNRQRGAENALRFTERPESVFRIAITVSNFSRLATVNPGKHVWRLAESLQDLRQLWESTGPDGKPLVLLSPQFVEGASTTLPHSHEQTLRLLEDVCQVAGIDLDRWQAESRIFDRPVIGLGQAVVQLGVTSQDVLPITAEVPWPTISRHPERIYSGMITIDGRLAVLPSPRGLLGRERGTWQTVEPLDNTLALLEAVVPTRLPVIR